MAKPIVELLTELQGAVAKAEADQTALQAVQTKAASDNATAKAAYDAVVAKSAAAVKAAAEKSSDSSAYVRSLQDEVNSVLGRFDSRVRVG